MLKLKLQYFGQLIGRTDPLEKTMMLRKIEGSRRRDRRGWDGWMISPTQWTWVWVHSRSWWWTGRPGVLQSMGSQRVRHDWATELNWQGSSIQDETESFQCGDLHNITGNTLGVGVVPGGSVVKNLSANAGDTGSIPGSGRFPREGNGNPLQYSCLGNPMDRGALWATVHGVTESRTGLSD